MTLRSFAVPACALVAAMSSSGVASADNLSFSDPKGDDNGFGKTEYPTGKDYTKGAFDLVKVDIKEDGDQVIFEVEISEPLTDPWNSKDWNGNGFSLQFVQIYIDMDGKKRSGERAGIPGSWIEFEPTSYYEKVILLSPQPRAKVLGEIDAKARWLKKRVIVPARTEARRKSIIASVSKKELGGAPSKKWGVQVLMLSNEGFAAKEDVLARRLNELPGEHRFGGGCDGLGDPQILDMLAGRGAGTPDEVKAQHSALSKFSCAETAKKAKLAKIQVVHSN